METNGLDQKLWAIWERMAMDRQLLNDQGMTASISLCLSILAVAVAIMAIWR
jgi:hypothetical protein